MIEVLPFAPRAWQIPMMTDEARDIVFVVHRRAGKTAGLMWRGLRRALTIPRRYPPPRVIHSLPYQVQWDRTGLFDELTRAAKGIKGARVMKSDMRVILPNGGIYQAGGMDKPDSWRGGYADEIIIDEYDDTNAEGQMTALTPMLSDFKGTLVRSGTPKGFGQLKSAYDRAKADPDASTYLLTYRDTGVLTDEAVATMRKQMTPEEFAQELECSFDAPNSGAYYAQELREAEAQGRICRVDYDAAIPVYTAWDIGLEDDTIIWWYQVIRGEIHVIDYHATNHTLVEELARIVLARGYAYKKHYLPHDAKAKTLASGGRSVMEQLAAHLGGISMLEIVPDIGVQDGIHAVRMMLPRVWFDAEFCEPGIKALRQYRRDYNEGTRAYRQTPRHDWTSHTADAFRMMAVAWQDVPKNVAPDPARMLLVGPENEATLNDMWAIHRAAQKRGRL